MPSEPQHMDIIINYISSDKDLAQDCLHNSSFTVGTTIEFKKGRQWQTGTITHVHGNEEFTIKFEDEGMFIIYITRYIQFCIFVHHK